MATNCTNSDTTKNSEGTTQHQRYLDALHPDGLELMGFSVEEWMDFAYKFSEKVNFYNDNATTASTTWKSFFEKTNEIKSIAKEYTDGDIDPHLTLFICFLKLLDTSKQQFDGITKRHLDFYYQEVLQLKKQSYTPDKVYALFELAKNVENQQIAKDTLLDGGKDTNGKTRNYAVSEELVVNTTNIAQLKSTYLDATGWYEAPIPNSIDGQGGDFDNESNSWMPFGNTSYANASFGFTIGAPSLKMSDGPRSIVLTFKLAGKNGTITTTEDFSESLIFSITGASGWITIPVPKEKIMSINGEFSCTLELSETDDAIINYDVTIHSENYNAVHPLIKIEFNKTTREAATNSFKLYKKLVDLTIIDIIITTTSLYTKSLLVKNDTGTITTENAFFPFGPQAKKNAKLRIKSEEWIGKNITEAVLKMNWKDLPDSFATHYSTYTESTVNDGLYDPISDTIVKKTMGDDRFTATTSIISKNRNTQSDLKTPDQINIDYQVYWLDKLNYLEDDNNNPVGLSTPDKIAITATEDTTIADNALFKSPERSEFSFFDDAAESYIPLATDAYFLQVELEEDFFQDVFGKVLTAQAIAEKAAPNAPYIPLAEDISVTITTEEHFNTLDKHLELFHNYPYGQIKTIASAQASLVSSFTPKGALFLGLENCIQGTHVQFLFQLEEGTENPDAIISEGYPEIEWHYLHQNEWILFTKEQLLKDETNNFLKTGLVKFKIPKNFDTTNTLLPDSLFWVRASQKSKIIGTNLPDTVSRFIEIHPQAVQAEFSNQYNSLDHLQNGIPSNTISKLINRMATVKKVIQPFASFDGIPEEDDTHFYRRISERLRHKNRAITLWDYEHLILQEFPNIHKVKCLNHSSFNSNQSPGDVLIVVVPDIKNQNVFNVYEPQMSANKLTEIEEYINQLNSSLVNARVVSPVYEPVRVTLDAFFYPEYDINLYTKLLKEDIAKFLAPWAFDTEASIAFNNTLHESEMIFYIENLQYVDYIKNFSLTHNGNAKQKVSPTDEKSILTSVAASSHIIPSHN
ncbi:hypothetical protein GCM10022393_27030 [Aquimarina addita]|uniref:Baseplate J-like protein n=1 Tax=Aquimarina addita TaxID=870485 RepID=A0ABP6UPA9_9FLAO